MPPVKVFQHPVDKFANLQGIILLIDDIDLAKPCQALEGKF